MPTSFGQMRVEEFLEQTASKQPTPGGGAVAAVTGALGAALGQMVLAYSLGKKSLVAHQPMLEQTMLVLGRAQGKFIELAEEDARAYSVVNELMRLPETDPRRVAEWADAVAASVRPPMAALGLACECARVLRELCGRTNAFLKSDLAIAGVLAEACAAAAKWNVVVNVPQLPEGERAKMLAEAERLHAVCVGLRSEIEKACG